QHTSRFLFCSPVSPLASSFFFFFNDTATTEIYPLSLHDALPIFARPLSPDGEPRRRARSRRGAVPHLVRRRYVGDDLERDHGNLDRKSTRLNSSHVKISYAVFCLKKKKKKTTTTRKKTYTQCEKT